MFLYRKNAGVEDEVINTDNLCHFRRVEGYEDDYGDGIENGI